MQMRAKASFIVLSACAAIFMAGCGNQGSTDTQTSTTATTTPATEQPTSGSQGKRATANIESKSGSSVRGEATFVEENGSVTLTLNLDGMAPGQYAVHLHEVGDCSAEDASSAGDHWNPNAQQHGHLGQTEQAHAGDIGNITIDEHGHGQLVFATDAWAIGGDDDTKNILNKSIVVHAGEDDFKSQPSGNAGNRIGCGVIE